MIWLNDVGQKAIADALAGVWNEIRDCEHLETLGALWLASRAVYDESAMADAISLGLYNDEHWLKVHCSAVKMPRFFLKGVEKLVMEAIARNVANGNKDVAKRLLDAFRHSHA